MPVMTYPNQRIIKINRVPAKSDFLGIQNANWQSAACDLGAHALMLYLYLASNANGYELALSPAAIEDAIRMPRSTYRDQFAKLVRKGYLVPSHGNTFDFYEIPQPRAGGQVQEERTTSDDVLCAVQSPVSHPVYTMGSQDIQINNMTNKGNNNEIIKEPNPYVFIPEVNEITIPIPIPEPKVDIRTGKPLKEKFTF